MLFEYRFIIGQDHFHFFTKMKPAPRPRKLHLRFSRTIFLILNFVQRRCAGHCEHVFILDYLWITFVQWTFKRYQEFYVTSYSETVVSYQGYHRTLLGLLIIYIRLVNTHGHDKQWTFSEHSVKGPVSLDMKTLTHT